MIKSFACKETRKIWNGCLSRKFPKLIQNRALRKLRQIEAACTLNDLRIPPGNHLELLSGDRAGKYSIRINEQWRVCFCWWQNEACEVEIADYH